MRKWKLWILTFIVGLAHFLLSPERKINVIGTILSSSPYVDSLTVKEGATKNEILFLSDGAEPLFSEMANLYLLPYTDLTWSDRKLLKGDPAFIVEYKRKNNPQYKMLIYLVKADQIQLLPEERTEGIRHFGYAYAPKEKGDTYIFAIKENRQLLGVTEGLKELIDQIIK